ncbi:hypothetical protein ACQP0C_24855 [Nocardia sp. CA-129566]|uniref:hypothetical protein n=1 Tax=Nocardia sp. CA-129566 TaxID=3239976 RepID=UPI003D97E3A9
MPSIAPNSRAGVTEITAAAPPAVGTVYRQPGGRTVSADVRITEFEPERKIVLEGISGPLRPIVEYTFVVIDGGTRVTFSLAASLLGLQKLLMAAVQRTMDAEVAGSDRARHCWSPVDADRVRSLQN